MVLTEQDKKAIQESINKFVILNGKKYYVKKAEKSFETTELIVQDLANLLDIKCAKYESVNIDGVFYYLSEDLNEQGRLIPIDVFMPNKLSLIDCWIALEKNFLNADKLMYDIVKIYLFDILFLNSDRHFGNIGLLQAKEKVEVVMLDNEFAFDTLEVTLTAKYSRGEESFSFDEEKYRKCERYLKYNLEELSYFLDVSSQEFINLFIDMYNKCSVLEVEEIIKSHDQLHAKIFIDLYKKNYELIGTLIKSRGR